ncbi:gliding motility protein [Marichromatium purpuratum 984]|uniref:Chemotaxis protein CheA n=1 Tax=Marichromatium purpuratum 984 TaxID=765910 RepID=W0E3R8_MARPU|nr:response regulator [Marichromatium purpuratum]AHF03716.1 gliding motility protein [Marichromatium purpuratum 984]
MAIDLQRFLQRFVTESHGHLGELEAQLSAMARDEPLGRDELDAAFRAAHTIKGSARMLKLGVIAETAHALEDVLGALREGHLAPSPELATTLLECHDAIGDLVAAATTPEQLPEHPDPALLARLLEHAAPSADHAPTAAPGPAAPAAMVRSAAPGAEHAPPRLDLRPTETVRVGLDKLDGLIRLMGELIATQGRYRQRLLEARALDVELARLLEDNPALAEHAAGRQRFTRALRDLAQEQERLTSELGDRALGLRMLPLSTLFEPIARIAREQGRALDKQVDCHASGGEIELDRHIVERLGDALVHLLSNAVDHGIESPEARRAAGKPALGRIEISARKDGAGVAISIRDDGRGLDRARILERAVRQGLIEPEQATTLEPAQVAELIFRPGFSTSELITEVSGRGVGMDVVRRTVVDELHGTITVADEPDQGTRLTLKVPLSLALMRVLLFESGDRVFALTAQHVERLIRVALDTTLQVAGHPTLTLDGTCLPLVTLGALLGLERRAGTPPPAAPLIIVIGTARAKLGLIVDRLVDERDMVIKPLPAHMRALAPVGELVGGIVTTGDETLVSVLQAPALLLAAARLEADDPVRGVIAAPAAAHHVLVVDDSLNTREIERDLLESSGYRVTLAEDGLEALDKAQRQRFDAVVSDVEMPGLDGFSLTARLRENSDYRATPIVIVSSRADEADRRRGIEVGANAYIVKGDFAQSSLVDTLRGLIG